MSKPILTNRQIFIYDAQIKQMQKSDSIITYLLTGGIDKFYHENQHHLRFIHEKTKEMEAYFFVMEDGTPKRDGETPVFLAGKTQYSFNKNFAILMGQQGGQPFQIQDFAAPELTVVEDEQNPETTEA